MNYQLPDEDIFFRKYISLTFDIEVSQGYKQRAPVAKFSRAMTL